MGFGEIIKQGLKSAGKAMVKEGDTVSTKKIDNGIIQKVNPYSKKVTVQSKDGKIRETVKADEVTVKKDPETGRKIKRKTSPKSIYIADEAYSGTPKKINEFSEADFVGMRDGEIRQKLIDSDLQSYDDLAKAAPGDSDVMKRVRFIGQNKVPGLRKTSEEKNKFREAEKQAKQEKKNQAVKAEQQAKKERAKAAADLEKSLVRQKPPKINSPGIDGDRMKLIQAFQRYKDTGSWKRGGSVNTKKKQYKTITNRFSDRMLPNKKRTTRIY